MMKLRNLFAFLLFAPLALGDTAINNLKLGGASSVLNSGATFNLSAGTVVYPVGQMTDAGASLAEKPACLAASTANVASLSGTTTIDGVALTAGQTVLLTAQLTVNQNGPWTINAGAWTRPAWYPTGGTLEAYFGVTFPVILGTASGGSLWYISSTAAITIGTTNVTLTQVKYTLSAASLQGTLPIASLPSLVSVVTDSNSSLTEKPIVKAVAIANVASLSGTTTIDAIALAAGDPVLLTAQSTGAQNGPWLVQASTWSRPAWYTAAGTNQAFFGVIVPVVSGTINAGSRWYIATTGAITIDTTATTWTKIPGNGGSLALLSDVSLSSPTNTQVLTYNGSVWVNAAASGGGGALNSVIGSATFNPSSGAIVGLVKTGVISAVTRTSAGLYAVTVSPATTGYTVALSASDDSTTSTDIMIAGTSISTSAFSVTTRNSTTGAVREPNVVHITVLGVPTGAYIKATDTKTSGTSGGTTVATTWTARTLQTVDTDTTGAASIATNILTIPAGTYRVRSWSYFGATLATKIRLFDTTNSATIVVGDSSYAVAGGSLMIRLEGRFTAATSIGVRVEYYAGAAGGANSAGAPTSAAAVNEVYTTLILERE